MVEEPTLMEEWRKIADFPDYSVSNHGNVRRDTRGRQAGGLAKPGMTMKPYPGKHGHMALRLTKNGQTTKFLVHRLVATAFNLPKRGDQTEVAHNDGNPRNNHVSNLRWATRRENAADTIIHGTVVRGTKSPRARVTEYDVKEIRERHSRGEPLKHIALDYGIAPCTVSAIAVRRNWSHVE